MRGFRAKGIALISVMMMAVLLLALIGAFVTINQANSRLTLNSTTRTKADDACTAMVNIGWSELENDPDWGNGSTLGYIGPDAFPPGNAKVQLQQDTDADGLFLRGIFAEDGDFANPSAIQVELRVYNNLTGRHPLDTIDPPVPPRSVRLRAVAHAGTGQRVLDVLMRRKSFVHESAYSSGHTSIGTGASLVRFESNDPYVNRIRGRSISLPSAANTRFAEKGEAVVANGNDLNLGAVNLKRCLPGDHRLL